MVKQTRIQGPPGGSVVYACFFFSGFAGLIYEIVWMRVLRLVTGNTTVSVAAVLAIYMTGLAIGSGLAGRLAERTTRPLRTYAWLEGTLGLLAAAVPAAVAAARPVFGWIFNGVPAGPAQLALRIVAVACILIIPASVLGAGLPVVAKRFSVDDPLFGARVGRLYALNSLGGAVGAFAAGFGFLPMLGVTRTNFVGVALDLGIFVVMGAAARSLEARAPAATDSAFGKRAGAAGETAGASSPAGASAPAGTSSPAGASSRASGVRDRRKRAGRECRDRRLPGGKVPEASNVDAVLALVAVFVSGLTAMVFEVAWTRVLSLNIGSSTYAFSLILTAFIIGIALGSLVSARLLATWRRVLPVMAMTQVLIGLAVLLVSDLLGRLPVTLANGLLHFQHSGAGLFIAEFALVLVIMVVPTFLLDSRFPMAARVYAARLRKPAASTGRVYLFNTAGSVVGSLAAVFLLIPLLGLQRTVLTGSLISVIAGSAYLIWRAAAERRFARLIVAVVPFALAAFGVFILPAWNKAIMTSGPFLYSSTYRASARQENISIEDAITSGRALLYFRDGLSATVSVRMDDDGNMSLQIDGKSDASSVVDRQTEHVLAQLPLLMHPNPTAALMIGLGSGITLGSLETYPLRKIDFIEISQSVVDAAKLFHASNRNALDDPRLHLHITDGRNWVAYARGSYDLITSEPTNPWIAGMSSLFTREFFQLASARLNKGGVMVQWLHAYSMSESDFRTVVRNFASVFPHTTVWESSIGKDYLLVGSGNDPFDNAGTLASRTAGPQTSADLASLGVLDLPSLLSRLVMDETAVGELTRGAPVNTDDNSLLEFSAPLNHYRSNTDFVAALSRLRDESKTRMGRMLPGADAADELTRMVEARKLRGEAYSDINRGNDRDAFDLLSRAQFMSPHDPAIAEMIVPLRIKRGNDFVASGDTQSAFAEYEAILNLSPDNAVALSNLGSLLYRSGRLQDARGMLERAVTVNRRYALARFNLGET